MAPKPHEIERTSAVRSVRKAVETGTATVKTWHKRNIGVAPHSWRANYAGNCQRPITVEKIGRPLLPLGKGTHVVRTTDSASLMTLVEYEVPCRQCDNCLRRRAAHWRLRAMAEYRAAPRTWFGSLTLNPQQHSNVTNACRLVAMRNGDDFDTFSPEAQFALRDRAIYREVKLYLKRMRTASGASIRFLCVAEAHKNGLPHYHMLVHEAGNTPIRHALLSGQWRIGFSQWKLVADPRAAGYVTKYLSKSAMARVRASAAYGNTSLDIGISKDSVTPKDPRGDASVTAPTPGTDQRCEGAEYGIPATKAGQAVEPGSAATELSA